MTIELTQLPNFANYSDGNGFCYPIYCKVHTIACQSLVVAIARGASYVFTGRYTPSTNSWEITNSFNMLPDNGGWNQPQYYSTLRCLEFEGKIYVIARGSSNLQLANFDPVKAIWTSLQPHPAFGDKDGFDAVKCYDTFRVAVVDGKLWAFIRGVSGFQLCSYCFETNSWEDIPPITWLGDSQGFAEPQCYESIQFVSVDHKLVILVRSPQGIELATFYPSASRLEFAPLLPLFSNAEGGDQPGSYRTIRSCVVDKKVFVCGVRCGSLSLMYFDTETGRWNVLGSSIGFMSECVDKELCHTTLRFLSVGSNLLAFYRGVNNTVFAAYNLANDHWEGSASFHWLGEEVFNRSIYTCSLSAVVIGDAAYITMRGNSGMHLSKLQISTST